ncbi:peptidoglycan/xylan/chitin deacetylase (PgdA/CDA1 family) [Nakamurella sp. UYEF19]|uniref:polysaccharide deacetylase family protein n=1 Tax=Nakamurella sp. UYEF19 TaxID=1756392 RepID=UPI003397CF1B
MTNRPRRALLAAGIGLVAAGVVGCSRGIQAVRDKATGTAVATGAEDATPSSEPSPAPSRTPSPPTVGSRATLSSTPGTTTSTRATTPAGPVSSPRVGTSSPVTGTPPSSVARTRPTSRPHIGPAAQIAHGPSNRPRLALTFHGAGDIAYAREILAIAKRKNARITVMVVGTWLADNPAIGREILAGGHEIGNHTLTHLDINSLSETAMRAEVVGCRDILLRTTGVPGAYFRQSQSPTANQQLLGVAGDAGYAVCLSYDLDSLDWTDPGAAAVRQNMLAARAGSIVSLHLGHSGTVEALPGVLDDLAVRGLSATTVSTLLGT